MSNIPMSNTPAPDTPKSDVSNLPIERCPKCSGELRGAIEVTEGSIGGLEIVIMRETEDRNWITCDGCNQTICKSCCVIPDSGYCDECFVKYKIEPRFSVVPTD